MSTSGRFRGVLYGGGLDFLQAGYGPGTVDIKAANAGVAIRFMATSTKVITAVSCSFSTVTNAGASTMTMSIVTVNATTGKPTATLYDANATMSVTPTTGAINTFTFASAPTTPLVPGTEYAVIFITGTAWTAALIYAYSGVGSVAIRHPSMTLTSADAGSTWTEVTNSSPPVISFVFSDSSEDSFNALPFGANTNSNIFDDDVIATKIKVFHVIKVAAVCAMFSKAGTPAGNIRAAILSDGAKWSANLGTSTIDKDSILTHSGTRRVDFFFNSIITLLPGIYRIVFDSASSANSSNCWIMRNSIALSSVVLASKLANVINSLTTDISIDEDGVPTWTDDATGTLISSGNFVLDDILTPINPMLQLGL